VSFRKPAWNLESSQVADRARARENDAPLALPDTRERAIWRPLATHDFTTVDAWPGSIPTMWSATGSARPNAVRGTSCRAQMLEAMAAKCTSH
jgi:hypothetical protein